MAGRPRTRAKAQQAQAIPTPMAMRAAAGKLTSSDVVNGQRLLKSRAGSTLPPTQDDMAMTARHHMNSVQHNASHAADHYAAAAKHLKALSALKGMSRSR